MTEKILPQIVISAAILVLFACLTEASRRPPETQVAFNPKRPPPPAVMKPPRTRKPVASGAIFNAEQFIDVDNEPVSRPPQSLPPSKKLPPRGRPTDGPPSGPPPETRKGSSASRPNPPPVRSGTVHPKQRPSTAATADSQNGPVPEDHVSEDPANITPQAEVIRHVNLKRKRRRAAVVAKPGSTPTVSKFRPRVSQGSKPSTAEPPPVEEEQTADVIEVQHEEIKEELPPVEMTDISKMSSTELKSFLSIANKMDLHSARETNANINVFTVTKRPDVETEILCRKLEGFLTGVTTPLVAMVMFTLSYSLREPVKQLNIKENMVYECFTETKIRTGDWTTQESNLKVPSFFLHQHEEKYMSKRGKIEKLMYLQTYLLGSERVIFEGADNFNFKFITEDYFSNEYQGLAHEEAVEEEVPY